MLNKFSSFFWRIAGWKTFLPALGIYFVFGGYIMPRGAMQFEALSGKKVEILDLRFFYSPDKARSIISEYTDASRSFAIQFGLMADTVYPVAYTFLFLIITSWIFKALSAYGIGYRHLHLFPLIILPVDYFENISIATMMKTYPAITDANAYVATFFTSLKWTLVIVLTLITISALLMLIVKRFSKAH